MIVRLLGHSVLFRVAAATSAASLLMLTAPSFSIQIGGLLTLQMTAVLLTTRPTLFEAVIPVDARRMFLARTGVGLALLGLPLIAWILSGQLRGVPAGTASALLDGLQEVRLVALPIAALAVIVPHASSPGVLPLPGRLMFPARVWAVLAIGCAAAVWLPTGVATVVLAGAAIGALAFAWHRMPQSYQVAAPGPERSGRTSSGARDAAAGASVATWWRPMLRTMLPRLSLLFIVVVGLAGLTDGWLLYLIIFSVSDMAAMARLRLQWIHTLPLPRTVMVWGTLTPAALSLLAVLLVGAVVGPALFPELDAIDRGRPHEYSRDFDFERHTIVPLAYWRIAPRREAQMVRTPWGETTTTDIISLPGLTLYNPYSARKGSSTELIEWQFGRATAAVHGRSFTTAQYYAEGFVAPPRATRTASVYLIGGSLAFTFVILIAWLFDIVRWHALTARPVLRYAIGASTGALVVSMVVLELYVAFSHGTEFFVHVGAALAMRAAATLPNPGVVAVVAALPVMAAYSLLYWQIGRSDVMRAIRKR